jgi:LPXTG cell wall anchor motif
MRRGRGISGVVVALLALALAAPAVAANGPIAFDQGYPNATQPPAAPGGVPPSTAPVGTAGGTQVVTLTPSSGTLGAQKTLSKAAPATRPGAVAPTRVTKSVAGLPFTGAQLSIFAIVGLALIAGGLLLRSTGRSRSQA